MINKHMGPIVTSDTSKFICGIGTSECPYFFDQKYRFIQTHFCGLHNMPLHGLKRTIRCIEAEGDLQECYESMRLRWPKEKMVTIFQTYQEMVILGLAIQETLGSNLCEDERRQVVQYMTNSVIMKINKMIG